MITMNYQKPTYLLSYLLPVVQVGTVVTVMRVVTEVIIVKVSE